jgi:predicted O-methyltransferase YrrM
MSFRRRLKNASKRALRKVFELGQFAGYDVLPRHFYSQIPDIRLLRKTTEWKAPYSMTGVAGAEIERQLEYLRSCCELAIKETIASKNIHALAIERNGESGFGPTEAAVLYALIRAKRPAQIFQIGCGVSTAVCLMAAEDAGYQPEVICVEPYPTDFLLAEAAKRNIILKQQKAQSLELSVIEALQSDVLFFVDSSHTLGPTGEVSRIILEMLPRLKRGAYVHFHDITFPYDYGRDVLNGALFFWHESVLLHAFLAYNGRFAIAMSLSMLHYSRPEALAECVPGYIPADNDQGLSVKAEGHFPSSTYLRVVA